MDALAQAKLDKDGKVHQELRQRQAAAVRHLREAFIEYGGDADAMYVSLTCAFTRMSACSTAAFVDAHGTQADL